jgi:signal peptidase I
MSERLMVPDSNSASIEAPVKKKSRFREYAEALLTAALIAFVLRAFVVEAFKIPSKSMVPTLMVGDHIFVNKFIYGIRIPLTKYWPVHFKKPARGDVVVFIYPKDESLDFIKRVVGIPGDQIRIQGDDLFVNGQKVEAAPIQVTGVNPKNSRELLIQAPADFPDAKRFQTVPFSPEWDDYSYYLERLGEHTHLKQEAGRVFRDGETITVPEGKLFVMGDNRDNSADSREWGFVPMENLKGQAMFIWLSRDRDKGGVRWHRFGDWIR